jgi:gliding motility-associated lipoprotein GldD
LANYSFSILSTSPLLFLIEIFKTPLSPGIFVQLILIFIFLLCSAFISGSEVAFFSLKPSDLGQLKSSKHKRDQLILSLLARPKRLLASILIANTLVNITIVVLSTFFVADVFYLEAHPRIAFFLQVIFITFIIVLIGEIIPKVYAARYAITVARLACFPIFLLDKFLTPLSASLVGSTTFLDKRMRKRKLNVTPDELSHAIDITVEKSAPEDEKRILKSIARFSNIDVKQVMTPRMDVVAVDIHEKFPEVYSVIRDSGYSRVPVYDESFDSVKGVLFAKDLISFTGELNNTGFDWQKHIRPAYFVPESKKINDLLREFQEKKTHLAIVVDEFGGTSGIVTMEDVLEEIVGEINDEFDEEHVLYSKVSDGKFIFEGKTLLNDVSRIMNIDRKIFDTGNEEIDTLAGLVLELSGKIPPQNEEIRLNSIIFTIESVDRRKIKRIRVSVENNSGSKIEKPPVPEAQKGSSDSIVYMLCALLCSLLMFLTSCDEEFTPRPRGFFRLNMPEKKYKQAETFSCPFSFEIPDYSSASLDSSTTAEPCWLNIYFEKFNATLYLSYKQVDNNLPKLIEDNRQFTEKHMAVASGIKEQNIYNPDENVYGMMEKVKGNAASPLQFFVTDSTKNFLRGSLYFYAVPQPDSIAPAVEFIGEDIEHLIETFRWK